MAAKSGNKRPIKFRIRKSSLLVKVALIAVLVLSIAALLVLRSAIQSTDRETEALRTEAIGWEQKNAKLNRDIDDLGTVEGIKRLAMELLGLVDPNVIRIEQIN